MRFLNITLLLALFLALTGCDKDRSRVVETPPDGDGAPGIINDNFAPAEREQFYHLAEGSEIFPVKWLLALHSSKTQRPFLEDTERFGLIADAQNPGGLPVGLTASKTNDLQFASMQMAGVNCAACHTAQFNYRGRSIRVDGAPALFDIESFYRELADSAADTVKNPGKFALFLERYGRLEKNPQLVPASVRTEISAERAAPRFIAPDAIARLVTQRVQFLQRLTAGQKLGTAGGGFGRTDALGRLRGVLFGEKEMLALDAPVSFPPLWGFADRTWLHWDANTNSALERNIGQALGLGATFDPKRNTTTLLLHNLRRLEDLARKIPAPRWPEELFGKLDAAKLEHGRTLYAGNCARCHDAPHAERLFSLEEIGTDAGRLKNFSRPVNARRFPDALHDALAQAKGAAFACASPPLSEADRDADFEWRDTQKYVARPLAGVWATPPYLHNGSVPSLYDLLRPDSQRPRTFPLGHRAYDPVKVGYSQSVENPRAIFRVDEKGNSNSGHEFAAHLSDDERLALLEFLKSL